MDKYYQILGKVLSSGKMQSNKKGNIRYLLNEQLTLLPADLLDIFEGHTIARKKLKNELQLFMRGERNVEKYREAGINWSAEVYENTLKQKYLSSFMPDRVLIITALLPVKISI